jgi:hypothetical protein
MGTITTTTLADSVAALYDADYLVEMQTKPVFSQLVNWRWKVTGDARSHGSTRQIPVYGTTEPAITARTITEDATPVVMFDGYVTMTPYYYDYVMQKSALLDLQAYTEAGKAIVYEVAQNAIISRDSICRAACVGGSYAWRYGGVARTALVYATSGHKASLSNFAAVMAQIQARGTKGFGDNDSMVAPVHPLMAYDVLADSTFLAMEEYGPGGMKSLMNAEIGKYKLLNLRFLSSRTAKLYLAGGSTVSNAHTHLSAAVAAGATAATVDSGTGFAAGDYLSLGTLEAAGTLQTDGTTTDRQEMVQLLSVSTNDLTWIGVGSPDSATNTGCRFVHASGADVVESCTVAAVPICGSESILGTYSEMFGKDPKHFEHPVITHAPGLLYDYGWQWYGGFTRHERSLIVAEFAVSGGILGTN